MDHRQIGGGARQAEREKLALFRLEIADISQDFGREVYRHIGLPGQHPHFELPIVRMARQVRGNRFGQGIDQQCHGRVRRYGHAGQNRVVVLEGKTRQRGPFFGCFQRGIGDEPPAQGMGYRVELCACLRGWSFDLLQHVVERVASRDLRLRDGFCCDGFCCDGDCDFCDGFGHGRNRRGAHGRRGASPGNQGRDQTQLGPQEMGFALLDRSCLYDECRFIANFHLFEKFFRVFVRLEIANAHLLGFHFKNARGICQSICDKSVGYCPNHCANVSA